jgi:hypothetical protein
MRFYGPAFIAIALAACAAQPKLNPEYARWSAETSAPPPGVKSDWQEQKERQEAERLQALRMIAASLYCPSHRLACAMANE